ncbi:MAG: hypothetical protein ISR65_00970 [Bacteriovoracaceae bacterium]|nr:hypothetical protein [Bacteriovoracaceae bacterium]
MNKLKLIFLVLLLGVSFLTYGDDNEEDTNRRSNVYVSAVLGNGMTSKGDRTSMPVFNIRIGQQINEHISVQFVHANEGHPENDRGEKDHRDGFGILGAYRVDVNEDLKIELSAGPYFSMNTTDIDGVEVDDKNLGVLASVAALYYLNELYPGLHIRTELDHVEIPGEFKTTSLMIGIGQDFDGEGIDRSSDDPKMFRLSLIGSHYKTNHGGTTSAQGFQIEAGKQISENIEVALAYIDEGVDERVDREGVAAMVYYELPLTDEWSTLAGVGPYVARNELGTDEVNLHGIITLGVNYQMSERYSVGARFSRIVDPNKDEDNDRDKADIVFSVYF